MLSGSICFKLRYYDCNNFNGGRIFNRNQVKWHKIFLFLKFVEDEHMELSLDTYVSCRDVLLRKGYKKSEAFSTYSVTAIFIC